MWIPEGFAHGFLVLSDFAETLYKATDYYAPQHERTLLWNDPALGIEWPLRGTHPDAEGHRGHAAGGVRGCLLESMEPRVLIEDKHQGSGDGYLTNQ